jgi:hypothetical protein
MGGAVQMGGGGKKGGDEAGHGQVKENKTGGHLLQRESYYYTSSRVYSVCVCCVCV